MAIAAIFTLLITLTVTVFAGNLPTHAQGPDSTGDPLFAALAETGMIEPLDLTQTIDDFTVTLAWVYADVNTLAVHYTVEGLPSVPANDANVRSGYIPYSTLADDTGTQFSYASGQVGPVGDTTGSTLTLEAEFTYYPQGLTPTASGQGYDVVNNYFSATYGETLPERVPLTVSITLVDPADETAPPMPGPNENLEGIGPFEFAVDVPLYPATVLNLERAETVNDLTVSLERIEFTPVQAVVYLCYDLPDGGDWQPVTSVVIEGETGRPQNYGLTALPSPEDVQRCTTQTFGVPFSHLARSLTVSVDALRTSIPETRDYWEAVRDELAEHDIEIEVIMGGGRYYDIVSYPDDMTDLELGETMRTVQESLLPTVDGPWVFEVSIP